MTVLVLPLIFVFTALTVLVFAFGAQAAAGTAVLGPAHADRRRPGVPDRLASNHGHQRLGGRKANERPARAVVRDPGRDDRAGGRHGVPGRGRGAGAERVGAGAGLRAARDAQADGPGAALLADQRDLGAARPDAVRCGVGAGPSCRRRRAGPGWPARCVWPWRTAGSPSSSSGRCCPPAGISPDGVHHRPVPPPTTTRAVPWPAMEQVLRSALATTEGALYASSPGARSWRLPSPVTRRLLPPGPAWWSRSAVPMSARSWTGAAAGRSPRTRYTSTRPTRWSPCCRLLRRLSPVRRPGLPSSS